MKLDWEESSRARPDALSVLPATAVAEVLPPSPAGPAGLTEQHEEPSDDELVAAVRRGDPRVGPLLYARLVRVIDATLTRVIGPQQVDHDDLVQATFEEIVRTLYRGRFKGRCRLTSWAASIACHVGLNAIRSRRVERRVIDRDAETTDASLACGARDLEPLLEARDDLQRLSMTLASLSPARAEAILLHDALGYDLREVAALTSSTEAAVLSRLARGRRDLLQRFARGKGEP